MSFDAPRDVAEFSVDAGAGSSSAQRNGPVTTTSSPVAKHSTSTQRFATAAAAAAPPAVEVEKSHSNEASTSIPNVAKNTLRAGATATMPIAAAAPVVPLEVNVAANADSESAAKAPAAISDNSSKDMAPGVSGVGGAAGDRRSRWEERFEALKQFVQHHGHARVSRSFIDDPALANWVDKQRQAYRAEQERKVGIRPRCTNRISKKRIAQLEAIGFEWKPLTFVPGGPGVGNVTDGAIPTREPTSANGAIDIQPAKRTAPPANREKLGQPLKRARPDLQVNPQRDVNAANIASVESSPIKPAIGVGVAGSHPKTPRLEPSSKSGEAGTLSETSSAQVGKRDVFGDVIATSTKPRKKLKWEAMFVALEQFVKKHGHARVPGSYVENPALGIWVKNQRRAFRAEMARRNGRNPRSTKRMTEEKIERLQSIGFEWRLSQTTVGRALTWDDRFKALKAFVKDAGHARVPVCDRALGNWVRNQRRAYRAEQERKQGLPPCCTHRITLARIQKLESIGFEWAPSTVPEKPVQVKPMHSPLASPSSASSSTAPSSLASSASSSSASSPSASPWLALPPAPGMMPSALSSLPCKASASTISLPLSAAAPSSASLPFPSSLPSSAGATSAVPLTTPSSSLAALPSSSLVTSASAPQVETAAQASALVPPLLPPPPSRSSGSSGSSPASSSGSSGSSSVSSSGSSGSSTAASASSASSASSDSSSGSPGSSSASSGTSSSSTASSSVSSSSAGSSASSVSSVSSSSVSSSSAAPSSSASSSSSGFSGSASSSMAAVAPSSSPSASLAAVAADASPSAALPTMPEAVLSAKQKTWNSRFVEFAEFVQYHGHARVPDKYSKNPSLGEWVRQQRQEFHQYQTRHNSLAKAQATRAGANSASNGMSLRQIQLLDSVGFEWAPYVAQMFSGRNSFHPAAALASWT